ncbi:sortase [Streptomyces noursei]|uniref:sortase n=1 Tax=Streptomyces noursei TaxID=1971 RepID=UPI0035D88E53
MPENPHATDAAEPTPSSDTTQTSRMRRNVLIGAAVAAAVAVGLGVVRWTNSTEPVTTAPKTAAVTQDPLAGSRPSPEKAADHTDKASEQARKTLNQWSESNPAASDNKHTLRSTPETGVGGSLHEVLRIPALGASWVQPIYEGVGQQQLRAGVGHFEGTAEPGEDGNFAVAGHRSGVASPPFRDIDRVKPGSAVMVTTADRATYTYTVTRVRVVAPTDVNVLLPVPDKPNVDPTTAKLTIVTCWPATGHTRRVVVEADLTSARGGVR